MAIDWRSVGTGAVGGATTGSAFGPWGAAVGGVIGALPGFFSSGKGQGGFYSGTPERNEQRSTLGPEQQSTYAQLRQAGMGRGAGGAFGDSADYYRDLMGNDSADYQAFAAPEMRKFNEQIIPDLAEQYAGYGSRGGASLGGSGFRNAAVSAGVDLSERLGAIRAQLRMSGAQGLANIGAQSLGNYNENLYHTAKPGFFDTVATGIGNAIPGVPSMVGDIFGKGSKKGQSSPYGDAAGPYGNGQTYNPYTDQMR